MPLPWHSRHHPTYDGASVLTPQHAIAVVIPHLDQLAATKACCEALTGQTIAPARILVVDSASTAHTTEQLAAACPAARILRLEANRGFAYAVNQGLRTALDDRQISHVWVVNNDTLSPPDTLARLLEAVEVRPDVGLAGCPMREGRPGGNVRMVAAGHNIVRPWMLPVRAPLHAVPDFISGACLLIKRAVIEDIGLLDEQFFFFFEDMDFCARAAQAGWRQAVAHEGLIQHTGSATIGAMTRQRAAYYRAGHIRYLRKHVRFPRLVALPPFLYRLAVDVCTGRISAVKGTLAGWRAGWGGGG